ncbi:MAG: carbon storage regulator CsrA [Pirellulaceae bacterium]|nr:carbon storage regulator CsrA [Pirellulaceae bacterium]
MLVLSRKKNESIVINNDITIVVVEIRGDKVRLGVEAPKEIPVHRREVYDAIRRVEKPETTPPGEHRSTSKDVTPPADTTRHPKNAE